MVKKKGSQPQRDNFVMIPRIISSLGLSPFAYRLYAEIKDVAGEGGKCFQSTRTLATSCGMSIGQISEAKRELVRAALILVQKNGPGRGRGHVDEIVVVDVWHENHAMYHQVALPIEANRSPGAQSKGSPSEQSTPKCSQNGVKCSPGEISSGTKCSRGDTKQEEQDNEQEAPSDAKASVGIAVGQKFDQCLPVVQAQEPFKLRPQVL